MFNITAYQVGPNPGNIHPLNIKRDWMERTYDRHAYNCFPVTLTNGLGWGISFPEEISFVWDGVESTSGEHVKVLSGHKYVYTERANSTISFKTGIVFRTDQNLSLLQMPVPNLFVEGTQAFTILMSTSFWSGELPCAWRITKPNSIITIPANQPVISVLPISLTDLNNSEIILKNEQDFDKEIKNINNENYSKKVAEINSQGKWSNFYRDATNSEGESIGNHEIKAIRLKVIDDK